MPVYDYSYTDEAGAETIISVYLTLNEAPEAYRQQEREGRLYKRVYTVPLAAKDTRHNDCTKEDFRRNTTDKKLTVGDMADISKEMSQERAAKVGGRDPVKEAYYQRYEREMGDKHHEVKKREAAERANKSLGKLGLKIKLPT